MTWFELNDESDELVPTESPLISEKTDELWRANELELKPELRVEHYYDENGQWIKEMC